MKVVNLPSGAKLEITLAPFADAHALQKAMAKELINIKLTGSTDIGDTNLIKDVICSAIASDKIENAINVCMKRCTYNGVKITPDTFEPEEARGDYYQVCSEVAQENILPFTKSLYAQFGDMFAKKAPLA